jgi:hypothetical protein
MLTTSVEDDPINIMRDRNNGNTARLVRSGMIVHSIDFNQPFNLVFSYRSHTFAFGVMSTGSLYT